jgi:hypothetical protein
MDLGKKKKGIGMEGKGGDLFLGHSLALFFCYRSL